MAWDLIAPTIVVAVFIVVTGGVILLRPLSSRLGELLEVMTEQKRGRAGLKEEAGRMREALEAVESRMAVLEERQDFHEELLAKKREAKRLDDIRVEGE